MSATTLIEVRQLVHIFNPGQADQVEALKGVDLQVRRGEFLAIVGANGSGKSTLARHLNGLLLPTAGDVWVAGMNTRDRRHCWTIRSMVGMVFQNPDNQLVASTVEEDVAFGPENLGLPRAEIARRVERALRAVGMWDRRADPPHRLSGGQKQRVAIAGVLAMAPACVVLDEATAMLDPQGRREVLAAVKRLHETAGMTVVLITHFMEEAAQAQRVVVMDRGRVASVAPPRELFTRVQWLRELGLDVPPIVELADRLRRRGWPIPPGILTAAEMAEHLGRV